MITSQHIRKLFSSPVFLFLFYTFFFGVLLQFFTIHERPFSWKSVLLFGVPCGIVLTAISLLQIKKFNESLGLTDPQQIKALHAAIKTGELPSDPQVRKALPAFLHKRFPTTKKLRSSMIILGVIGGLQLLTGLAKRNLLDIGWAAAFLLFFTMAYLAARRSAAKIDHLYKQLGIDPELITTIPKYPDALTTHHETSSSDHPEIATTTPKHTTDPAYGVSDTERNRSKWILIAIAVIAILAVVLSQSFQAQQQATPITSPSPDDSIDVQQSTNTDNIEGVEVVPDPGTVTVEQPDTSNDTVILQGEPVANPDIYNAETDQVN